MRRDPTMYQLCCPRCPDHAHASNMYRHRGVHTRRKWSWWRWFFVPMHGLDLVAFHVPLREVLSAIRPHNVLLRWAESIDIQDRAVDGNLALDHMYWGSVDLGTLRIYPDTEVLRSKILQSVRFLDQERALSNRSFHRMHRHEDPPATHS